MIMLKLLLVIVLLLVLISRKVNLALAMLISSAALLLISGGGPLELWLAVKTTALEPVTYTMAFTILFIGVLGYVMERCKMLDRMVAYLEQLVRSAKLTILLSPALIGLLLVTGGALMSCPIVNTLGERLGLPNERRAAVNLIFRHGMYFLYPLSTTLILAAQLGGFRVYELVLIQAPVTIFIYLLAYLILLRDVPDSRTPKLSASEFRASLLGFLVNASPILICLVITIFGVPFHWSLPVGILTALAVNRLDARKDRSYSLGESVVRVLIKGINYKMVLVVLGVLLFKNAIAGVSEINDYILGMVGKGVPMELVILVTCMLVTFPTGNFQPSLAICYPFIMTVAATHGEVMLYSYILYGLGFLAYYVSPLHMCQVLTLEYFKTSLSGLIKTYRVFIPVLAAFQTAWYFVLKVIL